MAMHPTSRMSSIFATVCRVVALSISALLATGWLPASAADMVWVGGDSQNTSNFTNSGNWQGNVLPSWGYGNSLKFSQNVNSNVTGLNYNYGSWQSANDIVWDTSFPVSRTLSASNGGGIGFKTRIENNSSFTQTVAMEVSGGQDGAPDIQLNPVNGSLIFSGTLWNDFEKDYVVWGGTSSTTTTLTLNTALGTNADPQSAVDFTVSGGRNSNVQVNASQVWAGTTTVNSGSFITANGVTLASSALVVAGGTVASTSANTFADTATLTVNSGRFSIGGSDTVASLAGSGGTVDIASGATLTAGNAGSTSYAGSITGSGGFTKVGSGTFTLSAASSYTGTTTVSAGQLSLGGANLLADTSAVTGSAGAVLALGGNETIGSLAGSLDVALGSSTLTVGGDGQSTTYSGGLSGSGGLTKVGSGTFTLSAASSYTGPTTVSAGQLSLAAANLLSDSSAVTGSAGAVLALGGNETIASLAGSLDVALGSSTLTVGGNGQSTTYSGGMSGAGGLTKVGSGTFTLQGNNSYNGGTLVSAGRLVGTTSSLQGAITNNAAVEFAQATSGTYAGSMTGSGVLTKSGAGALLLTGSNGFSGGAALNAGTLAVGSANALGSSGVISFGGGTLQYSASNATDYSGRFSNAAGQLYSIDTNGQDVTLATALTSSGGSLTKLGPGTLVLTGNNTFAGTTTISQGTLQVGNGATAGNLPGPRAIGAAARLLISNTAYSNVGWSTITGSGTLELDGGSAYGNWGSVALPSGFTGTLQVDNAGRFDVSGTSALGNASAVTIQSGAQMLVNGFSATFSQALSIAGFGSEPNWNYGALRSIRNGTVFTGPVTLTGNAGLFTQNDIGVSSMTLSGNIVDGGAGYGLTIRSDDINNPITLSGSNSFSGDTLVTKGVFNIGGRFALAGSTLDTSGAGSFALTAAGTNTYVLGGLKGSKAFAMGANSLEVGGNGQSTTYSGILSGSGGFSKVGAGTLTLSGSNSSTGLTSVNAGGLKLNGSIAGGLNVAAIAALSGTGTVGGSATIAGTHSPGNSPGTQTFNGGLTYEAGALVNWELIANTTGTAGVNYDQIIMPTGNLTFSGSTTLALAFNSPDSSVNWSDSFWNVNRAWMVYDLSGGTTASFSNLFLGGSLLDSVGNPLSPNERGYFTTSLSGQDVMLNFVAVPEPATWAMALTGLVCGGWMLRRRR
jgi:autotransporter-associated beta strand protein